MKRRNFIKNLTVSSGIVLTSSVKGFGHLPYVEKGFSNDLYEADILIYGGTSAAVMAAVSAKKLGKKVIIVSPDRHIGGMTSGGLGFTDVGNTAVIGGLTREFYHRIYLHYQKDSSWNWQKRKNYGNRGQGISAIDDLNQTMWVFEPHVAENIFDELIAEYNIPLLGNERIDRRHGVKVANSKISYMQTLSGKIFKAKVFIDATYEGDLMAAAGVSYYVGREGNSVYHERWNGVETGVFQHAHHFKNEIDPYRVPGRPDSGLLPRISCAPPGIKGEGDQKIQAYCYRMCLTNNRENQVPFPEPEGYDPHQYELLVRLFNSGWDQLFHKFDAIPNMKTDTNNHGPFSTDNIGMNYAYPEGSYDEREKIIKEHITYQQGLMYFMATDHRIPKDIQRELNTWGLARDEFTDTGHWPHQLYIRESRRLIGYFMMAESEILGKEPVSDSIGMGSYGLDSHNTQRYVTGEGFVQNEGDIGVGVKRPYGISYRALVPKEKDCKNLIAPVCASCSHTAYGSIRMEPVFMILGESAAVAATIAVEDQLAVQQVDYGTLRKQLLSGGQVLEYNK